VRRPPDWALLAVVALAVAAALGGVVTRAVDDGRTADRVDDQVREALQAQCVRATQRVALENANRVVIERRLGVPLRVIPSPPPCTSVYHQER
jgi:hypothetical protein